MAVLVGEIAFIGVMNKSAKNLNLIKFFSADKGIWDLKLKYFHRFTVDKLGYLPLQLQISRTWAMDTKLRLTYENEKSRVGTRV